MTKPTEQHPWSKYYAERGLSRPPVGDLAPRLVIKPRAVATRAEVKVPGEGPAPDQVWSVPVPKVPLVADMSPEMLAAVAAVTSQTIGPGDTAAPFITAMQRVAVEREIRRRRLVRYAQYAAGALAVLTALHLSLTRTVFREPLASSLQTHIETLPATILPLYSSARQPLQVESVALAQAGRIDGSTMRYVAAVTLRLRQPLYVPAVSNGTLTYRRLQESLIAARNQEMRFNLFAGSTAPEAPELPLLLRRAHQAGEMIVVRVPFLAHRIGWNWRLEAPLVEVRVANRVLDGDNIDRYADTPYLIFGGPETLVEFRRRVKLANAYVQAVAKTVQRQADVVAIAPVPVETPVQPEDATLPPDEGPDFAGGFDPHAPAIEEAAAHKVAEETPARVLLSGRRSI